MVEVNGSEDGSEVWKKFLRKHWNMVAVFVLAAVLVSVGAVYIFLWFVGDAQSTGLVPRILGQWTMGHLITFILHIIFWELLLIGIPVVIGAVLGWVWWRRIPIEEKREYHFFGRRSRTTGGGGGVSLFFFIAFAIKAYIDGNWNVAISTFTLDYVVYSMLLILIWALAILGIPATIALVWWIGHGMEKKP